MKIRANKIGAILVITFFVSGIIFSLWERQQLIKNHSLTTGEVFKITVPGWKGSSDYSVMFNYSVNDKLYSSNQEYKFCDDLTMKDVRSVLIGKKFPVVYLANDIGACAILITEKNARSFNYKISDSLKVYDSILTCKR